VGKRKSAPRPQSIDISGILTERFRNEEIEVLPCSISIGSRINEEKDHMVSVRYGGEDMSPLLDSLLAQAKEEIETERARIYLHACRKVFSRDENNRPLIKGLNLYYRLKSQIRR